MESNLFNTKNFNTENTEKTELHRVKTGCDYFLSETLKPLCPLH